MIAEISQLADNEQTICAISTPPGRGGIAIIRVSGPEAFSTVEKIWKGRKLSDAPSHTAHLGYIIDPKDPDKSLDQVVATTFKAPGSFTGQDTVEISVHGSTYIQSELIRLLISNGARLAMPGEFTRRAYTNGHLDLAQAEAVADIIASDSRASHRLATSQMQGGLSFRLEQIRSSLLNITSLLELELDFSEEEVEFASRKNLSELTEQSIKTISRLADTFEAGQAIKDGIPVAIIGAPNAGKSSLLNLLLDYEKAIVTPIPGTTRDLIEDTLLIEDYRFRLIDTAGLRRTEDPIEKNGISLTNNTIERAAIIIYVHDST
ncbi:MAG: tRNA uridine-5-carboxymethylaminomethyl(34) synthesis GTPase MnmE, partial [Duncaniella sp.]|nr:tRNA uridine-5-carboxymethylaminomethyl(34) synthesis GTPase MnmE [Duncaniella sp.]